jgi:hypothetical protein
VGNWLISHWSSASNQVPACVAETGTPADVGNTVSFHTWPFFCFSINVGAHVVVFS